MVRSSNYYSFMGLLVHINNAARFLFFSATLVETWIGNLNRRISAVTLGAFILERFVPLDFTEKNILLGVAVVSALLIYSLLRYNPSPAIPSSAQSRAS